jgi:hypothetical protein
MTIIGLSEKIHIEKTHAHRFHAAGTVVHRGAVSVDGCGDFRPSPAAGFREKSDWTEPGENAGAIWA